jgi:hypothetical protein
LDRDRKLEQCFSPGDCEFALMAPQIDAALEWVGDLRDHQVGWSAAKAQIEDHLKSKGVKKSDAKRQIERARELVRPWLV